MGRGCGMREWGRWEVGMNRRGWTRGERVEGKEGGGGGGGGREEKIREGTEGKVGGRLMFSVLL